VSGKPFPQFMEEQVFKPLGMTHTRIFTDEASVSMLQVARATRADAASTAPATRTA
jgi:CubicO group peptidase (beta-lactamase class C family)